MTREEAIDIIKCLAWHTRPSEEDVEQAIKALEQEPCEDAISRQATLAHGTCKDCEHFWCFEDCASMKVCSKHSAMRVSKSFYCKDFEPKERSDNNEN